MHYSSTNELLDPRLRGWARRGTVSALEQYTSRYITYLSLDQDIELRDKLTGLVPLVHLRSDRKPWRR